MEKDLINKLNDYVLSLQSVVVAFSGGVDSTFLLKACHNVLKKNCVAVTVSSCFMPERELQNSIKFCKENNIEQIILNAEPLQIAGVKENPVNRCYLCKYEIFMQIKNIAKQKNILHVLDGTNFSDTKDFRPGIKALQELQIKSPLKDLCFTKDDVRTQAKKLNIANYNAPSFACLASRFAYGEPITKEALLKVEKAEDFLCANGFIQFRARVHKNLCRIEVLPEQMEKLFLLKDKVYSELKKLGFDYVTLDLKGFETNKINVHPIL